MNSRARRLCYPRSNFSVISSPHQGGHRGSLGQYFYSGCHLISHPVRLAFALALYSGLLTRLSQPLGPADIKSSIARVYQSNPRLLVSFQQGATPAKLSTYCCPHCWVSNVSSEEWCFIIVYHFLRFGKLPPTLHNKTHVATISYSKVSRGLHFPLEIPGLCTRI